MRIPELAKNAGSRSTVTGSCSFGVNSLAMRLSCGITAPSKKAPNTAWTPIHSVPKAQASTRKNVPDTAYGGSGPGEASSRSVSFFNSGRATKNIPRMNNPAAAPTSNASPTWAWATPTTRASKHHAVTSSAAAHPRATTPRSVRSSLESARMRASTGKAVMAMATPRNRAKLVNGTALCESVG